jgi:fucose permease
MLVFFFYTGVEATPGQWMYDYYTQARAVAPQQASTWEGLYWGTFTIGRILFGIFNLPYSNRALLRAALGGVLLGALLLAIAGTSQLGFIQWFAWPGQFAVGQSIAASNIISFIGLAILGFSQAPIFPLMVSESSRVLGWRYAAHAVGFQVATAGIGIALLPSLAGSLTAASDIRIVTPYLLVLAVLLFTAHEVQLRVAGRHARRAATVPASEVLADPTNEMPTLISH